MPDKWNDLSDKTYIKNTIDSIIENIACNLFYEIDENTGDAKYDPITKGFVHSGISENECKRIANKRGKEIKQALKTLKERHNLSRKFQFMGRVAYCNHEAGAYFMYYYFEKPCRKYLHKNIFVFAIHSDGFPLDTTYPDLNSLIHSLPLPLHRLLYCYEHHLRIPLRVRESLRRRGYRVVEGRIIDIFDKSVSE